MIMTAVVPRFFGGGIGVAIYRTAPCFLPLTTSKAEGAHNAIAVLRARERKTAGSISDIAIQTVFFVTCADHAPVSSTRDSGFSAGVLGSRFTALPLLPALDYLEGRTGTQRHRCPSRA